MPRDQTAQSTWPNRAAQSVPTALGYNEAHMKTLRAIIISLSVVSLGSCGGGDAKNGSIPSDQFAAKALDAICTLEVRCGGAPDKKSCEGSLFEKLQTPADIKSGKILYDGSAAADCLATLASEPCSFSQTAQVETLPPCMKLLAGTVAVGGACLISEECVSQSCNLNACAGATCCQGTCRAQVPVGGDCTADPFVCTHPSICRTALVAGTSLTKGTCVAPIAAGQPCTAGDLCAPGKFCNTDGSSPTGTCGDRPQEGKPCPDGQCDQLTDRCDSATNTCVAKIAVGGACAVEGCVDYARCDPTSLKCVALAAPGAACTTSADCFADLPCDNGTCTSPPAVPACP